jgi:hypothetical protein
MKQTVEEAAREHQTHFEICDAEGTISGFINGVHKQSYESFISGAQWQSKQSPWISVKERLPEENENIIIMCEHGAIFNGTYCNGVWFCMDGYIHDIYKSNPIYSSMSSIPSLWEPVAWMPIPSFDDILEANKDVLERIKEKGD